MCELVKTQNSTNAIFEIYNPALSHCFYRRIDVNILIIHEYRVLLALLGDGRSCIQTLVSQKVCEAAIKNY